MAKKRQGVVEEIIHKYAQDFFSFLFSSLEKGVGHSFERFADLLHIKRKIKRYAYAIMLAVAGLFLIFYGIALWISSLIPSVNQGIIFFVFGLIVVLAAYIVKKSV